jgi:tight adherence protein B
MARIVTGVMTTDLHTWLIPLAFALSFGGLGYVLFRAINDAMDSYAENEVETARQFENIFLFIPHERLVNISRIAALILFALFFLLAGDFTPQGLTFGFMVGGIMAGLALAAPRILLKILRQRRLERFNEQLVDGLLTMSNALRAGFSITQAFESVVKERRDPIAQEFGMLLQQIRVGVKMEEALQGLDERVGSEDLTLMLLAIETARQTGGNLTEVFDKIAVTIRERLRIKGRINSLTAQGRLQGIVVGAMPFLLFLVLTMLDPAMMKNFYTSLQGMIALAVVILLDTAGFLMIRKIVRIDI